MMVRIPAMVCLLLALGACTATEYRAYEERSPAEAPLAGRQVFYKVEPAFYDRPPDCVVVLAPSGPPEAAGLLEEALARHLAGRMARVVGPLERRRAERSLAVDLGDENGRKVFAAASGCPAFLQSRIIDTDSGSALVWSGRRFGAAVEMTRAADEAVLWQASHTASRSDGGVPLSPLSLPVSVFNALRFGQDSDQLPSMVDDVVRRMIVTLPRLT
jgi:hypothetical protein